MLEIGTGWGGFALHAARTRGCRVTTTTLSREQRDLAAVRRIEDAGLERPRHGPARRLPRADRRLRQARLDRDDRGRRLEGLRHVLRPLRRAAAPRRRDGAAGDHDRRPPLRRREGPALVHELADLPERLPAVGRGDRAQRRAPLATCGWSTSRTSRRTTRRRCGAGAPTSRRTRSRLAEIGYDERFQRLWTLYLSFCEAGFTERRIGSVQVVLAKPRWRGHLATAEATVTPSVVVGGGRRMKPRARIRAPSPSSACASPTARRWSSRPNAVDEVLARADRRPGKVALRGLGGREIALHGFAIAAAVRGEAAGAVAAGEHRRRPDRHRGDVRRAPRHPGRRAGEDRRRRRRLGRADAPPYSPTA